MCLFSYPACYAQQMDFFSLGVTTPQTPHALSPSNSVSPLMSSPFHWSLAAAGTAAGTQRRLREPGLCLQRITGTCSAYIFCK